MTNDQLCIEGLIRQQYFVKNVPADITYLFQPLDVQGGPNRFVKRLMKKMFTD